MNLNRAARELREWNKQHPHRKRGLAITPVKFGISFTTTHLNQAGALVLLYQDGTVQINHGGTEMGQGVHTNIALVAARELGLTTGSRARHAHAHRQGAEHFRHGRFLRHRSERRGRQECVRYFAGTTAPVRRRKCCREKTGNAVPNERIIFNDNMVLDSDNPSSGFPFAELLQRAYFARTSLSSTGFYRTPEIHYDRAAGRGKPFHYFAVGAAVSEVEVDGFTGMMHIRRVDILHDVGDAINAGVARGQIEGGFVQGAGWLTNEELVWDSEGRLLTHSPDTYKIPAVGDTPDVFNIAFLVERDTIERDSRQQSGRRTAAHAGDFGARSDSRCDCCIRKIARRNFVAAFPRHAKPSLTRFMASRIHSRLPEAPGTRHGGGGVAVRKTQHKLRVARGEEPAELLFKNAQLVNVLSGEIHDANVAVDDGRVIGFGDYEAKT